MSRINQDGAIHAMGNGRFLVYGRGADINNLYGPPYTSASPFSARWIADNGKEPIYKSQREAGTNIWQHELMDNENGLLGAAEHFVTPDFPAYLCEVDLQTAANFILTISENTSTTLISKGHKDYGIGTYGQLLLGNQAPSVTWYYPNDTTYTSIVCWGEGWNGFIEAGNEIIASFGKGKGYMAFIGGPSYPEACQQLDQVLSVAFAHHRMAAVQYGNQLTHKIKFPAMTDRIDQETQKTVHRLCENVAFLITSQQSEDGGIAAGHRYPYAYVRDQYGTCRGLLALSLYEEAKRNLLFRMGKWKLTGTVQNAESMGHNHHRSIHENDEVEVTGYVIMQAFDYAEASGDWDLLLELFPMLEWCWEVQTRHFVDEMLPFNGDETYVAMNFLPRTALNDGSMEATLLFIEGSRKLIRFADQHGLWQKDQLVSKMSFSSEIEQSFRNNFFSEGRFIANAPARTQHASFPLFRQGVCENYAAHAEIGGYLGWNRCNANGRYMCPSCSELYELEAVPATIYEINSAGLLPMFINSSLLTEAEAAIGIKRAYSLFEREGILPSREGSMQSVGYDIGLLLYGLGLLQDPAASKVFEHVLSLADSADAWVEVYDNKQPIGCRCRPWESGMNIAGIIKYVEL